MKKLHFKTSKGEFLLFETHEGAYDVRYEYPSIIYEIDKKNEGITRIGFGTRHDLELIGNIEQLTEEQAKEVVDYHATIKKYKNYSTYNTSPTSMFTLKWALVSLYSLVKSLDVHFENPISNDDRSRFADWVEWRKKVWNKSNTYLFKKI